MSDWLIHYQKGRKKKKHKYLKRESIGNNRWRYWYILKDASAKALDVIPESSKRSDVRAASNELQDALDDERKAQKEWNAEYEKKRKEQKAARNEAKKEFVKENIVPVIKDIATNTINNIKDIGWLIKHEHSKLVSDINPSDEKRGRDFLKFK